MAEQGPRINAALHLTWSDVDFTARLEALDSSVRYRPEWDKLGRDRVQPLTAAAREALLVALGWSRCYNTEWVFPTVRERPGVKSDGTYTEKSFLWMLHEGETRAKVDYIPRRGAHSLRRMAIGNALAVSKNVVDGMWWIGDTDLRQAKKYATERDARMGGDVRDAVQGRCRSHVFEDACRPAIESESGVSETVPKPSRDDENTNAPVEAGALSVTTSRS